MPTHEERMQVSVGGGDEEVMRRAGRLRRFYEANGYQWRGDEARAELVRGESGAGWWTSNMTELAARVTWREVGEGEERVLSVLCSVDVTGQHLTDEDKAYWDQEARTAREFAQSDSEEDAPDLRPQETARAAQIGRQTLLRSATWALAACALLFVVGVVLERLGFLMF